MRRRAAVAVLLSAVVAVLAACWSFGGEGRSGVGLTYDGRFYWSSGQEISARALGDVLETNVPFQFTKVDVRRVDGLDPDDVIAARLPGMGDPPGRERWQLLAADEEVAADPRSHPTIAPVLAPATVSPTR